MPLFSDRDRALVEALVFEPALKPGYELLKGCLIWREDEVPDGLTPDGYETLCDLLVARRFIHLGKPFPSAQSVIGCQLQPTWETALASGLKWNGFRRLKLSPEDDRYLRESMVNPEF